MKRYRYILSIIIVILILLIQQIPVFSQGSFDDKRIYTRAKIIEMEVKKISGDKNYPLIETRVHLKILEGPFSGKTKVATFSGETDMPADMFYQVGNTVFIGISTLGSVDTIEYISLYDVDNTGMIIFMMIILMAAVILIGRIKGIFSLTALSITIMLVFFVLIPLTLKGYPPLPLAVLISIISICITLPVITGLHLKTLSAILGATGGVIFAALLAMALGQCMHLSGLVTNEMLTVFYSSDVNIDLRGLALSSMIIAALGAVMDVCISISSSTAEIFSANPHINRKDAFKSVLNIGTDILGSMVNTLILAYVGSSLSLILLISMRFDPGMPVWMIFNYNPILSEIVKSVVGSLGMFLSIPLTAYIAVWLYSRKESTV